MQLEITDTRPASILRLVGNGSTARDAATKIGMSRKTIERWRQQIIGFGEAYDRAVLLSRDNSAQVREELDRLVRAWDPGGLLDQDDLPPVPIELTPVIEIVPEPPPPPEPEPPAPEPEVVPEPPPKSGRPRVQRPIEPDVLDARGKTITTREGQKPERASPYTTDRPPTQAEWLAEMAKIGLDKKQPERVRAVAIAAVSSALNGGPVRGRPAELEEVVAQAARERGREQGVPASVWQEARKNFLGPAPEEAEQGGDVVEFEQATTPG